MRDDFSEGERRRRAAFRRLGTDDPRCVLCGESDWRCLELHHVAGRAFGHHTAILCRNCHRKVSDPTDNGRMPDDPPILERIGHLLAGLAALFAEAAALLREAAGTLIEAARHCPAPWGQVPALSEGV